MDYNENLFLLFIFCAFIAAKASAFPYPQAQFSYPTGIPHTVYKGETERILLQMNFSNFRDAQYWFIPSGSQLEYAEGNCPAFPFDKSPFWGSHVCRLNIAVYGDHIGQIVTGTVQLDLIGSDGRWPDRHAWDQLFTAISFSLRVIAHPLAMNTIPKQNATAGVEFIYHIIPSIKYYQENIEAGLNPKPHVSPIEQDGLYFDEVSQSIRGKPKIIGNYYFHIRAKSDETISAESVLPIEVQANPKDKPIFKDTLSLPSAMITKNYTVNLVDLIKPNNNIMQSNQLSFRIDNNQPYPHWLAIDNTNPTLMTGTAPIGEQAQVVTLNLIAHSNTGGDSESKMISIALAYDLEKKPKINPLDLEFAAGMEIKQDLAEYIQDPATIPV